MNILCIICTELLTQPDDVFFTECGHVFHFQCLTQWIERSKSCPQCREKVTRRRVRKLYLTVSNNEIDEDNDLRKEEKITSLTFQIMLKEKDISHFMSKCATLEKQNAGLRKEVRKLESEICEKNSVIHALKDQIKYFKDQLSECQNAKKEVTQLKKKIGEMRNIQMLLDAPIEGVEDIIGRDKSTSTLLTYVYVMKKEILSNLSKIKHLRMKVKDLQSENARMVMKPDGLSQNYFTNGQLEEQLAFSESEKMALQSRVMELEKMLGILPLSKDTTIDLLEEAKLKCEIAKEHLENSVLQKSSNRKRSHENSRHKKNSIEKENTSCISIATTKDDNSKDNTTLRSRSSDSSIVLKKSRMSKGHEKMNGTNNMHEEDAENIDGKSECMGTETNMCSKTPKEKNEKPRKERSSKTKNHKRDIIDLT